MGAAYPCLRYPGNVSGAEALQEGCLLGWDEVGRPYEVLDTEWIGCPDCDSYEDGVCRERDGGHTNVYLQYATPENIRRQAAELQASGMRIQKLELELQLRQLMRSRT